MKGGEQMTEGAIKAKATADSSLRLSTPASKNRSPGTTVKNGYVQDDNV